MATVNQDTTNLAVIDDDYEFSEELEINESRPYNPMTEDELLTFLESEATQAIGEDLSDDELAQDRRQALTYWLGRARGDERPDRSKVISMDVADTIDATLADMMPVLAGSDQVVWFPPEGPQDQKQAQEETDTINHLFTEENNGYICLMTIIKEAMLLRNGIAKVYVATKYSIEDEEHSDLPPAALFQVMQPKAPEEKIRPLEHNQNEDGSHDIRLQRVRKVKKLRIDPIPIEDFRINGDHNSIFLDEARFMQHRVRVTRGDARR